MVTEIYIIEKYIDNIADVIIRGSKILFYLIGFYYKISLCSFSEGKSDVVIKLTHHG